MKTTVANGGRPTMFTVPGYEDDLRLGNIVPEQFKTLWDFWTPKLNPCDIKLPIITGTPGKTFEGMEEIFRNPNNK